MLYTTHTVQALPDHLFGCLGFLKVLTTHTPNRHTWLLTELIRMLEAGLSILTCSGWVGDQEGQPAILAARLALSLRRWV